MIDISKLNKKYAVRKMDDSDVENILELCRGNTLYYQFCEASPTREQIINDLHITPPNTAPSDKYYVGFHEGDTLVAIAGISYSLLPTPSPRRIRIALSII